MGGESPKLTGSTEARSAAVDGLRRRGAEDDDDIDVAKGLFPSGEEDAVDGRPLNGFFHLAVVGFGARAECAADDDADELFVLVNARELPSPPPSDGLIGSLALLPPPPPAKSKFPALVEATGLSPRYTLVRGARVGEPKVVSAEAALTIADDRAEGEELLLVAVGREGEKNAFQRDIRGEEGREVGLSSPELAVEPFRRGRSRSRVERDNPSVFPFPRLFVGCSLALADAPEEPEDTDPLPFLPSAALPWTSTRLNPSFPSPPAWTTRAGSRWEGWM